MTYRGNDAGAKAWAQGMAQDHGCKASAVHIADGPYDFSGRETHLLTVGDDKGKP